MTTPNLGWLLNDFVDRVVGATNAIVVSADGLLLAVSSGIDRETGDQLAAVTSGIMSLTQGAARFFQAGGVNQVIVEMAEGFLFVMAVGEGSSLAVVTNGSVDIGLVAYEMALLVARARDALHPTLIADLHAELPR
jgi:predicted regulator of Ras-like GTPase activity (Roadblock/LC7/MglB family)